MQIHKLKIFALIERFGQKCSFDYDRNAFFRQFTVGMTNETGIKKQELLGVYGVLYKISTHSSLHFVLTLDYKSNLMLTKIQ